MPFDGGGTFVPLTSPQFPAIANEIIYADYFNAVINDLIAGLSAVLPKDGQSAMNGGLNMNGNFITGLPSGGVQGQAVEWKQWRDSYVNSSYNRLQVDDFPQTPVTGIRVPNVNWIIQYLVDQLAPVNLAISQRGRKAGDIWLGVHDFSAADSMLLPPETAIGGVSPEELSYLEGATSNIQVQLLDLLANINTRGLKNGQVWTGEHDFTGGTLRAPTLPVSDSTNRVATMAALAAATLVATLPGQSGNSGKFITTDGTNASWTTPFVPDATFSTTTGVGTVNRRNRLTNVAKTIIQMPAAPANGDVFGVKVANNLVTNEIQPNGSNVEGALDNIIITNIRVPLWFKFVTGTGWEFV